MGRTARHDHAPEGVNAALTIKLFAVRPLSVFDIHDLLAGPALAEVQAFGIEANSL